MFSDEIRYENLPYYLLQVKSGKFNTRLERVSETQE